MIIKSLEEFGKLYPKEHDIELAIKYVLQYCNCFGPFSYNNYMERSFKDSLVSIVRFHHTGSVAKPASMVDGKIVYDQEEHA
tara:strand:+ start:316 stop:561 length:246 start_codon:yes stop_codon:yes gene_type:complete